MKGSPKVALPQLPTPHFRHWSRLPGWHLVLLTDQLQIRGSHDLRLGFSDLLEQLTKLRETVYLLNYQLMMKRYNSETAR